MFRTISKSIERSTTLLYSTHIRYAELRLSKSRKDVEGMQELKAIEIMRTMHALKITNENGNLREKTHGQVPAANFK